MHNERMPNTPNLQDSTLAHAWADLQNESPTSDWLQPQAHRLAFADPEFL